MLKQPNTKEKIVEFINEYFAKDSGVEIEYTTSFLDEEILDSTGVMELVAFIETEFGIKVEDEEIIPDNLDSINKLVVFVDTKLENRPKV